MLFTRGNLAAAVVTVASTLFQEATGIGFLVRANPASPAVNPALAATDDIRDAKTLPFWQWCKLTVVVSFVILVIAAVIAVILSYTESMNAEEFVAKCKDGAVLEIRISVKTDLPAPRSSCTSLKWMLDNGDAEYSCHEMAKGDDGITKYEFRLEGTHFAARLDQEALDILFEHSDISIYKLEQSSESN